MYFTTDMMVTEPVQFKFYEALSWSNAQEKGTIDLFTAIVQSVLRNASAKYLELDALRL